MIGIIGIIAALVVLGLSLFITRLATVALTLTGLSEDAAAFQARSAFTGVGFTTKESERIVNHPVRRRIIMLLMILRSAGIVSIIISLILSFVERGGTARITRLGWLAAGIILLLIVSRSRWINRGMSRLMNKALKRWTTLDARDYASLLRLSGDYSITNLNIGEDDWVANKPLRECRLSDEGLIVLGITRENGDYVGAPRADTEIYPGDVLLVYGRENSLEKLDKRKADFTGEKEHAEAVEEHEEHKRRQEKQEKKYKESREKETRSQQNA